VHNIVVLAGLALSSLQDPKLQKRAATVFEELKKLFANVQDLNEMTVNAILEENEVPCPASSFVLCQC